jgi:energy-coupling factor transport system substrate-specific component
VESVAITVFGANLVDKILTAIIVWILLRQLPLRTTRHFLRCLPYAKCIRLRR